MPSNQQLTWKCEHTGNTFSCQLQNLALFWVIISLFDPQPFAEWNAYIGKMLPLLSILTKNWHIMSQVFTCEYFLELSLLELYHGQPPRGYWGEKEGASGVSAISRWWSLPGQTRRETILKQKDSSCYSGQKQDERIGNVTKGCLFLDLLHPLPLHLPQLPEISVHCTPHSSRYHCVWYRCTMKGIKGKILCLYRVYWAIHR